MESTPDNVDKSIAFIVCYLGKLPWYFKYFVHSCKYNPTVDFYIITDDRSYSKILPPNVVILYKTLDEINRIASQRLGFKTKINYPYKLCDFKPTYGFLFPALIRDYDFWGYGDIDMVFGDIRNFITAKLLDNYELINVRHDYLVGYFLLYKNTEKMNTLFMESKDFKKVFSNEKYYSFDETNFEFKAFTAGLPPEQIQSEIESMNHVVKRLHQQNYIRAYFDLHIMEECQGKLTWEKGKLYYDDKYELLLYHFLRFKKIYNPKKVGNIPDTFHISPTRIYT